MKTATPLQSLITMKPTPMLELNAPALILIYQELGVVRLMIAAPAETVILETLTIMSREGT